MDTRLTSLLTVLAVAFTGLAGALILAGPGPAAVFGGATGPGAATPVPADMNKGEAEHALKRVAYFSPPRSSISYHRWQPS